MLPQVVTALRSCRWDPGQSQSPCSQGQEHHPWLPVISSCKTRVGEGLAGKRIKALPCPEPGGRLSAMELLSGTLGSS